MFNYSLVVKKKTKKKTPVRFNKNTAENVFYLQYVFSVCIYILSLEIYENTSTAFP